MAEDYDIGEAFRKIEEELIASMIRNLKNHRTMETDEGFEWSQWQVEQLHALEEYRQRNRKRFSSRFQDINDSIDDLIALARQQGGMDQEIKILNAIKRGYQPRKPKATVEAMGEFFQVNDRKLNALITATKNDFTRAEHAMLRMADDKYRKIIFNAQVYANAGGTTYEQAVDMATQDFLRAGINCIEYKNGARHTMRDYADMCIKTATKRAYLTGEGEKRMEWGESLVIVNKRQAPCPKCFPFCGVVLIDDVWSGGVPDGRHQLMSRAIERGLYHPRCKDIHTTYFPGISTMPDKLSREEEEKIVDDYNQEQRQNYCKRQAEQQERMAKCSLDPENMKKHEARAKKWRERENIITINGTDCKISKSNYNMPDGKGGTKSVRSATIYETPDGTRFVFPDKMDSTKQGMTPTQAISLWQKVPEEIRQKAQNTIEFVDYYNPMDAYWKKRYRNFTHSYATGGDKITFYRHTVPHDDDYVIRTYCHEAGHYIDMQIASNKKHFSSESLWTEAIKKDIMNSNMRSPTVYGENSPSEDFAESIAEYVTDRESFEKTFPNRAALLKQILGM